jgi:hypothetical protein
LLIGCIRGALLLRDDELTANFFIGLENPSACE